LAANFNIPIQSTARQTFPQCQNFCFVKMEKFGQMAKFLIFSAKYFKASYGAQQYNSWNNQKTYSFPLMLDHWIMVFIINETIYAL